MNNQVFVSQEILDALNAPPVDPPVTFNKLIWIKNAQQPTVHSTSTESLQ
jgi:hypothetical protein